MAMTGQQAEIIEMFPMEQNSHNSPNYNYNNPPTTATTTTSTSSSIHTLPGVFRKNNNNCISEHDYIIIDNHYKTYIDKEGMPRLIQDLILNLFQNGMKADLILNAIEETSLAKRPSAFYLRAILRRYAANGYRTLMDLSKNDDYSMYDKLKAKTREDFDRILHPEHDHDLPF